MTQGTKDAMADAETLKRYGLGDERVAPALRAILSRDYKTRQAIYQAVYFFDSPNDCADLARKLARSAFRAVPGLR